MEIVNPKASRFYNLDKSILTLPGYVFWKDINGHYLGCNDSLCELAGVSSPGDVQGQTDSSLPWATDHQFFRDNDQQVQKRKQTCCFIEPSGLPNNVIQNILSVKAPLIAMDGSVAGVIGASIPIEEKWLHDSMQKFTHFAKTLSLHLEPRLIARIMMKIVHLNSDKVLKEAHLFDYGAVIFSLREAQCLHYFLNHYSAQKTSEKLFISKKTVEFHLAKIKEKLNCNDMSKMTNLAINYGFIDLMFMKF